MLKLNILIDQLEMMIPLFEKSNDTISKSTVGWQIEHSLMTIIKITNALSKSNPSDFKWSFKLPRYIVFTLNKIPRGKAKAPEVVVPIGQFTQESLSSQIKNARNSIQIIKSLANDKFFHHPFFGDLKLKQAIKMLEIHTNHHLEIIRDIVK